MAPILNPNQLKMSPRTAKMLLEKQGYAIPLIFLPISGLQPAFCYPKTGHRSHAEPPDDLAAASRRPSSTQTGLQRAQNRYHQRDHLHRKCHLRRHPGSQRQNRRRRATVRRARSNSDWGQGWQPRQSCCRAEDESFCIGHRMPGNESAQAGERDSGRRRIFLSNLN